MQSELYLMQGGYQQIQMNRCQHCSLLCLPLYVRTVSEKSIFLHEKTGVLFMKIKQTIV